MKYVLQRYSDDGQSTLGLLYDDLKKLQGYTLEDEARATKVPGETRIWPGTYELKLRKELTPLTKKYRDRFAWFTWHVEILGVRGFSNAYVHVGNKDTDTDACVLIGDSVNNNQAGDGFISGSVECYKRWYQKVVPYLESGLKAFIEIRDESYLSTRH